MDDSPSFSDKLLCALLGAAMAAAGLWWAWTFIRTKPPAARVSSAAPASIGKLPEFSLTDETGRAFGLSNLNGKPWIASFIFTSCAGQCIPMVSAMRILQQNLPADIHLVSFTVDPKRDTPEVLADYAKKNGAEAGRWHFLTGETAVLEKISREGFKLAFADEAGPDEPLTHSVRLALVDREGNVRGTYNSEDPEAVEKLSREARGLLQ